MGQILACGNNVFFLSDLGCVGREGREEKIKAKQHCQNSALVIKVNC